MVNSMNDNTSEFCSIKEAAQALGVSPKTIQLWVENGNLRAWKTAGGHRRVIRESLTDLIKARDKSIKGVLEPVPDKVAEEKGLRVLVVEDEEVLRRLYDYNIRSWSDLMHVDLAKDGFEALLKIGNSRPDVLITDLSMPGMDGFKMLRCLFEIEELPAILTMVITSYDSEAIRGLGRLPDGVHVFEKPAPFKAIKQLIFDTYSSRLIGGN